MLIRIDGLVNLSSHVPETKSSIYIFTQIELYLVNMSKSYSQNEL